MDEPTVVPLLPAISDSEARWIIRISKGHAKRRPMFNESLWLVDIHLAPLENDRPCGKQTSTTLLQGACLETYLTPKRGQPSRVVRSPQERFYPRFLWRNAYLGAKTFPSKSGSASVLL